MTHGRLSYDHADRLLLLRLGAHNMSIHMWSASSRRAWNDLGHAEDLTAEEAAWLVQVGALGRMDA